VRYVVGRGRRFLVWGRVERVDGLQRGQRDEVEAPLVRRGCEVGLDGWRGSVGCVRGCRGLRTAGKDGVAADRGVLEAPGRVLGGAELALSAWCSHR